MEKMGGQHKRREAEAAKPAQGGTTPTAGK
jgi:hypothetical protein